MDPFHDALQSSREAVEISRRVTFDPDFFTQYVVVFPDEQLRANGSTSSAMKRF